MRQRPMCCLCLLLMLGIVLLDRWEFPLWRKTPVSVSVQNYLEHHSQVQVMGKVIKRTKSKSSISVYLENSKLLVQSKTYRLGSLRVFLKEEERIPIGASVLLQGKLKPTEPARNPGAFDSQSYYKAQHISYLMFQGTVQKVSGTCSWYKERLARVRDFFAQILGKAGGEEAGIFAAMLLGEKSLLEEETKLQYQMAGIVHVLAISGLHLSLLGMGLFKLLKWIGLGNLPAGGIALAAIYQYGLLTGSSVATLRAVSMFLLSVGAVILGRTYDMLTALAFGAILLLLESPDYLYHSGFLLSFGSVLGVGVVSPIFTKCLPKRCVFLRSLTASLAVQAVTLPILLYFYYEVSLYGIFLNLLVLPTVAAVLLWGIGGTILGGICLPAGKALLWPGRLLLKGYQLLCVYGCRQPWCTWVAGKPENWQILVYYGSLAGCVLLWMQQGKRQEERKGKRYRFTEILLQGISLVWVLAAVWLLGFRGSQPFTVTCLDVGQGDASVISTPQGEHYLCDGGSSSASGVGTYQILPFLKSQGISCLDGIFVSHTDQDHISGIEEILEARGKALTSVRVKALYLPAWEEKPEAYERLEELAKEAAVPVIALGTGDVLERHGLKFQVLAPQRGARIGDVNEGSLVLQAEYGAFRGLFTGDIGEETERTLLAQVSPCQFLKVAHHGSRYSSCEAFLQRVKPKLGVISCSASNTYGHPSPETLERLEEAGSAVRITRDSGAVTVHFRKEGLCVEEFRKEK